MHKHLYLPLFAVAILLGPFAHGLILAQTIKDDIIEIVSQPDSPLAMTAIGSEKADYGGIKLRVNVQNLGDKTIKAYTLSRNFQGPEVKNLKTFFTPLGSGQIAEAYDHEAAVNLKDGTKVFLLIDYVLFSDGTSWGKNSRGEAEYILGFGEGQKKAIAEIKKLIDRRDETSLSKLLLQETFTVDKAAFAKNTTDQWQTGFSLGYRSSLSYLKDIYQKQNMEALPLTTEALIQLIKPTLGM